MLLQFTNEYFMNLLFATFIYFARKKNNVYEMK